VLVKNFAIKPITTPAEDLSTMLGEPVEVFGDVAKVA
jgi:hypothetical protein